MFYFFVFYITNNTIIQENFFKAFLFNKFVLSRYSQENLVYKLSLYIFYFNIMVRKVIINKF